MSYAYLEIRNSRKIGSTHHENVYNRAELTKQMKNNAFGLGIFLHIVGQATGIEGALCELLGRAGDLDILEQGLRDERELLAALFAVYCFR